MLEYLRTVPRDDYALALPTGTGNTNQILTFSQQMSHVIRNHNLLEGHLVSDLFADLVPELMSYLASSFMSGLKSDLVFGMVYNS